MPAGTHFSRLASVKTPPKTRRPGPAPITTSPTIEALGRHPDADAVKRFWRTSARSLPMLEHSGGDIIVTFCWRDADADDVLLFVNRICDETQLDDSLMRRVPGTDIWHLSYRMRSDWRASYAFIPRYRGEPVPWSGHSDHARLRAALDRGRCDPRNRESCRNRLGAAQSVVSLPDAPPQPWLGQRAGRRGRLSVVSGPGERRTWVYEPAAPVPAGHRIPVLIVLDGQVWTSPQSLATTLDNMIDDGVIGPVYAVLVDSGGLQNRWREFHPAYGFERYITRQLLPWSRARYPISPDPADVIVIGQSLGALTALRTSLLHPDEVGNVLAQSASLWLDDLDSLTEPTFGVTNAARSRIYLECGRQEWVLAEPHQHLARRLRASGADVAHVEFNGGHDYACWRGGIADGLRWLLCS